LLLFFASIRIEQEYFLRFFNGADRPRQPGECD